MLRPALYTCLVRGLHAILHTYGSSFLGTSAPSEAQLHVCTLMLGRQADHLGLELASLLDADNHGQRGRLRGDALSRPQKRPLEGQGLWGLCCRCPHTHRPGKPGGSRTQFSAHLIPRRSMYISWRQQRVLLGHRCLRITVSLSSGGACKEKQSQRSAGKAGIRGRRAGPSGGIWRENYDPSLTIKELEPPWWFSG